MWPGLIPESRPKPTESTDYDEGTHFDIWRKLRHGNLWYPIRKAVSLTTPLLLSHADAILYRSGYKVLATSSPHNFDLLKSMGADAVFDYKDPDCALKIRQFTGGNLRLAWDCISEDSSAKICTDALASGGAYGTILQVRSPRDDVDLKYTLGYT